MATIHPIPSGTRDVLPDEMRELREITAKMRDSFLADGYGEIYTPAVEFESEVGRMGGDRRVYRLVDDHGDTLIVRSDLTVPIARVAATRYADAELPLRFCSFAHVYRQVKPHRGQPRESLHADCELIGAPAPEGTGEVLTVLCRALDAVGLKDYRIGLGDASLYPALCAEHGVDAATQQKLVAALIARDFVSLSNEVAAHGLDERLLSVPERRGGSEVLEDLGEPGGPLRAVYGSLPEAIRERVIFDLGLIRDLDYYTGAVFEIYDGRAGGLGMPLGGGGRYDDLLARFGDRQLPAVGFAISLDSLHEALAGEGLGESA